MTLAIYSILLAALALVGGGPRAVAGAAASADPPPDLAALLERARRVQGADVAAWSGYRFRRVETRQRLDTSAQVVEGQRIEAIVTPVPDGFDERLIEIDGRPPTEKEIAAHSSEGRFARRFALMRRGEGDPEDGGYSLDFLLSMASYRHAGIEEVEGVSCHRLDFSPGASQEGSLAGKFAEAMAGTLWITVEGLHVARASARAVSPISVALIVVRMEDLQLELESGQVGEGRWLPRRIDVRTRARIMGFPSRKRNLYEYLDFVRVSSAPEPTVSSP